ncbi:WD repeat-containing protein 97-like isoform X10 [Lytechinus variegatus]|uniref:WD repeat-containing protein 97-like isoform X10 n=1 Tax=Lytechinus variegatus TaxID=7654 RepID=UPI001BB23001|nr:WD repeat-containing protein 97-like isoform X10 [Lytechinus variegatus]
MSDVVAKILKEHQRRPGQLETETKGQFFWRILRESIRDTTKLVSNADTKSIHIGHGVHHTRKINHVETINDVLFNPLTQEYLTVDSHGINIFHHDGRLKGHVEPEEPIDRLVFCKGSKRYVGWTPDDVFIKMFAPSFELISEAKSPHPITCVLYNEQQNEVISAGHAHIMSWCFRYGAKHLVPQKVIRDSFLSQDTFTMLAVENTASRAQRCFAVCESNIAVFNLHDGVMLEYKRNLHVRKITSILFFNPLKYLVTGARDGSVKVWDTDWHLKLVFVGHRGPVTALSVYPYGPYIISGSEDTTMRVWSLETCDEVDLIEAGVPIAGLGTQLKNDDVFSFADTTVDLWKLRHIHNLFTTVGSKVNKINMTTHPDVTSRAMCVCRDGTVRIITPGSGDVLTTYLADDAQQGIIDAAYSASENMLFAILKSGQIIKADTSVNPCKVVKTWSPPSGNAKDKNSLNCICLYEYVVQSTMQNDTWKGIFKTLAATNVMDDKQIKNKDRTLLIGGRKDGYVAVLDWKTLKCVFKTDAHGYKGVLGVATNPKNDQLITAGLDCGMIKDDNVIKVWRVFPFAEESLTPLMSIYCAHMPLHMTVMKTTLCVAFQDPNTATYSLVHYNLINKSRNDHSPDEDHIDNITGLACNPRMKVFASTSIDGTIKIWDDYNRLIRCIKLNAEPYGVDFCSQRGDLLVGIGNHIHRISHESYMPKAYLRKMVSMVFPDVPTEQPLEYELEGIRALTPLSHKRLKAAHSSLFRFDRFVDTLTEEETEQITKEKEEKEEAYAKLAAREEELRKLRDGEFEFTKTNAIKKGTSASTRVKNEGFRSYWDQVHLESQRPDIPDYDDWDLTRPIVDYDPERKWMPEKEPVGFFPDPSLARWPHRKPGQLKPILDFELSIESMICSCEVDKRIPIKTESEDDEDKIKMEGKRDEGTMMSKLGTEEDEEEERMETDGNQADDEQEKEDDKEEKMDTREEEEEEEEEEELDIPPLPIHPRGFIPNSVLVRLIWPPEETAKVMEDRYRPPQLDEDQLAQVAAHKQFLAETETERVIIWSEEEEGTPLPDGNKQEDADKKKSIDDLEFGAPSTSHLAKRLGINIEEPTSPKDIEIEKDPTPTPPPTPPPEEPKEEPVKPQPKKTTKMKVEKLISKPKTPPPKEPTPTPPPPPTPSPPRPPTPLPQFITQFKGSEWFEQYFPNATNRTFPKPWTVSAFVTMLLRLLKIADYGMKTPILYAILALHQQDPIPNAESVLDLLLSILNKSVGPTCQDEDQKDFIVACLHFFKAYGKFNKKVVVEIMVEFVDGDKMVREMAHDLFIHMGLEDAHNYFVKELDSWDVWGMEEESRKKEVREMATMWLDQWMALFKGHLKRSIEQLQKGKLTGKIARKRSIGGTKASPTKRTLKQPVDAPVATDQGSQDSDKLSETGGSDSKSVKSVSSKGEPGPKPQPPPQKSLTVTFNVPPDMSALDNIQPTEAINYFVEMEVERHLEKLKMAAAKEQRKKEDDKKNTVLVLPKIRSKPNLVRLGETHTSTCKDRRETVLQTERHNHSLFKFRLPPLPHQLRKKMEADGLYTFTSKIDFPLKTYVLNPFPSPIDVYDQLHQPILLTLKTSQKYFVPGQSVVQSENYR